MTTLERVLRRFNLDPTADYTEVHSPLHLVNFSRVDLAKMFGELGFKRGVEVGVETAWYSRKLCQMNPGLKLYAVDAWQCYPGYRDHVNQDKLDGFYEKAKERLAPYGAGLIKAWSMDAVREFEPDSLDFVYLDGNHRFDFIMQDIIEWSKRVRKGGVVAGHDYARREGKHNPIEVIDAVEVYTRVHAIRPFFTLGGEEGTHEARSFFWVKL